MTQPKKCSQCGTTLPPDAPAGVCPRCLLKAGIDEAPCESGLDETLVTSPKPDTSQREKPVTETDAIQSSDAPPVGTKLRYPELFTTKNSGGRFGDVSLEIGFERDLDHITCSQRRMAPSPSSFFVQMGAATSVVLLSRRRGLEAA